MVVALVVMAWCLFGYFRAAPPASPTKEKLPSRVATVPQNVSAPQSHVEAPPPKDPLLEKVVALHGIGQLFGPGGEERMDKLSKFVEGLDDDEVPVALDQLQQLQTDKPTQTGKDLRLRLILRWSEKHARAAAEWTTTVMAAGEDRQEAIDALSGKWARTNVAEATAWAGELPDSGERERALTGIAGSVIYTAPQNSLTLAANLPPGPTRDDIVARASGAWADQAPEQAAEWARQIPDEALRQNAIKHIAFTWGGKNPVAAGDLAVTALPPGSEQDQAVIGVVQRWWLADRPAATAWVNSFPEGRLREIAMDTIKQTEARLKLGK